jgi:subtilisin
VVRIHVNEATYPSRSATVHSFAAPHVAGIVTLIRGKHQELTPFQVKTVLFSCAANTRREVPE